MFRTKIKRSNYCNHQFSNFKIINYDSDRLRFLPIFLTSEITNCPTIIGTIENYDSKSDSYNVTISDNFRSLFDEVDNKSENIKIGLHILISNDMDKMNIDLNDKNIQIKNAFLIYI